MKIKLLIIAMSLAATAEVAAQIFLQYTTTEAQPWTSGRTRLAGKTAADIAT